MIYFKRTNPVDAKPGDLMFIEGANSEYFGLYICINMHGGTIGNNWHPAKCFNRKEYEAIGEIVDGKPTPELIARFTTPESRESGKRFEREGETWVKTADGTVIVGKPIRVRLSDFTHSEAVYFKLNIPGKYETEFCFTDGTYEENLEKAEAERARLISWLEGA